MKYQRHHGMTSVLAMLFLVLFSTLAVGFYAMTNSATQISSNDERVTRSFFAAESGMDFMRYQLAKVTIPPNTAPANVLTALFHDLQVQLDGTGNLGSNTIAMNGNTISIPGSQAGRIKLDADGTTSFRATITEWNGEIVVKIDGYYGNTSPVARAITMDYTRSQHSSTVFDFAVASKGQIVVAKGDLTSIAGVDPKIAAIMSAAAATNSISLSGGTVGGDLSIVAGATASVTGGSAGGANTPASIIADHLHVVEPPEFPTLDPTVFKKYATNSVVNGAKTQSNIIIKAGTNPKFNANDTVQGIMYIESPNQVTFNGNFNLKGFIVMEEGASTTDALIMKGNLAMSPVPSDPVFDSLRSTSGVAILAPGAHLDMTGSSGGSVAKGNIMIKKFGIAGAASLTIDQGTLMTFDEGSQSAVFNGSKWVKFAATGANNQPTPGVTYSSYFAPKPSTYQEVSP
jgi:hypothetical protein